MKILYGIQLNGNGHLTRSQHLINELIIRGHTVDTITSGRNYQLDLKHKPIASFEGINWSFSKSNGIDWTKTILRANLFKLIMDTKFDVSNYDLVISDFEPVSAWSAHRQKIKSLAISNQVSFTSPKVPRPKNHDLLAELFMKCFAPCTEKIGLHYQQYDSFIVQPIIRNELLETKTKKENFFIVYLPLVNINSQVRIFSNFPLHQWLVYTNHSDKLNIPTNIQLKQINYNDFTSDFLNCSGIITACGLTTTSEAIVLNKKLWAIPVERQYEQLCNAIALNELGVQTDRFSIENLEKWLDNNPINYSWKNPLPQIIKIIESL